MKENYGVHICISSISRRFMLYFLRLHSVYLTVISALSGLLLDRLPSIYSLWKNRSLVLPVKSTWHLPFRWRWLVIGTSAIHGFISVSWGASISYPWPNCKSRYLRWTFFRRIRECDADDDVQHQRIMAPVSLPTVIRSPFYAISLYTVIRRNASVRVTCIAQRGVDWTSVWLYMKKKDVEIWSGFKWHTFEKPL